MIENPQPAWLPVLLLALPGIAFAAFALNNAIFPCNDRSLSTIPAIGIVIALLPTHVLALAFGSLSTGLALAWGAIGASGYLWVVRNSREFRFALARVHPGLARKCWITALATFPVIPPTILFNFFDEVSPNGHLAIIAHLQNGAYPPRYLYEPGLPLRYHYAFDLAGAIVTGILRIRPDQAIDFLTLALWVCMFLLLWRVGEHVGGKGAGLLVALAVSFCAGLCLFCKIFIVIFYQHPWSIAIPLWCLALLQRTALPRLERPARGVAALICSLLLLSLSEAALFVSTVAALALTEFSKFIQFRDRLSGTILLNLAPLIVATKLIGGFFVSASYPPAGGILGTGFGIRDLLQLDPDLALVSWNLEFFGIVLVLGAIGLFHSRHQRMYLSTTTVVGVVTCNVLQYNFTDDISKFATVSFIPLAIGVGILLSDLRQWANTNIRKAIHALLVLFLLFKGVVFHFYVLFLYDPTSRPPVSLGIIMPYFSAAYPLDLKEAQVISFLRNNMAPSEVVFRGGEKWVPYNMWGGLPTQASVFPAQTGDNDQFGLGEEKFAARKNLANVSDTWFNRILTEHVSWVVTDPNDVCDQRDNGGCAGRRSGGSSCAIWERADFSPSMRWHPGNGS